MNREQLEHIIRAAAVISEDDEGSAFHAFTSPPVEVCASA
jgi:hypothetical protein